MYVYWVSFLMTSNGNVNKKMLMFVTKFTKFMTQKIPNIKLTVYAMHIMILFYMALYVNAKKVTLTYVRRYVRTYIPTYIHTYIYTYIHTYIH